MAKFSIVEVKKKNAKKGNNTIEGLLIDFFCKHTFSIKFHINIKSFPTLYLFVFVYIIVPTFFFS